MEVRKLGGAGRGVGRRIGRDVQVGISLSGISNYVAHLAYLMKLTVIFPLGALRRDITIWIWIGLKKRLRPSVGREEGGPSIES